MPPNNTLNLNLQLNTKAVQASFKQLSASAQGIVGSTKAWKDALKSVNSELASGRKGLAKVHAQMSPVAIGKRVRLQLLQEDAQEQKQKAETEERKRQYVPKTVAGRLGKALGFDVSPGNKGAQSGLGGLAKSLGLGSEASGLLGGVTKALGPLGAAAGVAIGAFKTMQGIFNSIVGFVSKANPGAVQRLTMVFDDMTAVVGHSLTPIVELATKGFRNIADFLASILPSSNELRNALKPISEYFDATRDILADLAPILKDLISGALKDLAVTLKAIYGPIKEFTDLLKKMGIVTGNKLTSSVGAAAHQHTFQDSTAYAKSIYTAIASGQGREPQKETADNTAKTNSILESLKDFFTGKFTVDLSDKIVDALASLTDKFKLPDFSLPEFKFPEIKFPELALPDFTGPLTDAANRIPNAIKDALSELPQKIADAIKSNLPSLPRLPDNPLGEAARRAREGWNNFHPFG